MRQQEEIELAKKYNFVIVEDSNRGRGWNKFYKDNFHVWQVCVCNGICWQSAYLIDGRFCDWLHFNELENAFKRYNDGE